MVKHLILLAIFVFTFGAHAQKASFESHPQGASLPFKNVAIGIASPGPGVSKLGHAFLVFMTTPERLSESYAVQFSVSENPNDKDKSPELLSFFGVGKRFSTEAIAGLTMTNRYRMENRAVLLFRLNLSPSQLAKLWEDLREEHIRREQSVLTDYNFLSRNCLTEALRFVNNVLEPGQKKFVYLNSQNTFELLAVKYLAMPGLYMQNAPYAIAPQIASHPLVIGAPLVLPPAMVTNAKLVVKLEKQTQSFLNLCKANEKLREVATRANGQTSIRESQSYLNLLERLKIKCTVNDSKTAYLQVIQSIYDLSDSPESHMRIERYLP